MTTDDMKRNGWKRSAEYPDLWEHPDYPGSRFDLKTAKAQEVRRLSFRAGVTK
jgi:hypothetical protein